MIPGDLRRWLAGVVLAFAASMPAAADAAPERGGAASAFTDAQIAGGFFKVAFGAEYRLAGPSDRIRKFAGPVRVAIAGDPHPRRRAQLAGIVAEIGRRVRHLDIAMAAPGAPANLLISLVRDRDLARVIAQRFGRRHGRAIGRALDPQCLSGFRRNERFVIERAEVILPVDSDAFTFRDCAYEETLQALGPINDTDTVPWTMFNDDVRTGAFGVYDRILLNILYNPRIVPGMTAAEVRNVLPDILPDVRAFVAGEDRRRR